MLSNAKRVSWDRNIYFSTNSSVWVLQPADDVMTHFFFDSSGLGLAMIFHRQRVDLRKEFLSTRRNVRHTFRWSPCGRDVLQIGDSVIDSDRTMLWLAPVFGPATLLLSLDVGSRITPQISHPLNVLGVDLVLNTLQPFTSTSNVKNYVYTPPTTVSTRYWPSSGTLDNLQWKTRTFYQDRKL